MIAVGLALAAVEAPRCLESIWRDQTPSVEIGGATFHRVRGKQLKRLISGKSTGSMWFYRNGTYLREGSRGTEDRGRWSISRDILWLRLDGYKGSTRWMLFKSSDDKLATALSNDGCMETRRLTLTPFTPAHRGAAE